MNDAWNDEANWGPIRGETSGGAKLGEPTELTSPRLLASQLREMLGEDGELDARAFEQMWSSGAAAGPEAFRLRDDQLGTARHRNVGFAELNAIGGFHVSQVTALNVDAVASTRANTVYRAAWLEDSIGEAHTSTEKRVATAESGAKRSSASAIPSSITYQDACEVLGLPPGSSEAQIKSAYRRMASEWHPDRQEHHGERMHAFATQQMAAINDAYRLLKNR